MAGDRSLDVLPHCLQDLSNACSQLTSSSGADNLRRQSAPGGSILGKGSRRGPSMAGDRSLDVLEDIPIHSFGMDGSKSRRSVHSHEPDLLVCSSMSNARPAEAGGEQRDLCCLPKVQVSLLCLWTFACIKQLPLSRQLVWQQHLRKHGTVTPAVSPVQARAGQGTLRSVPAALAAAQQQVMKHLCTAQTLKSRAAAGRLGQASAARQSLR